MDLSELNIYPKFVPCKSFECDAPFSCSIETAYAILENMNQEKPNSTFNFTCKRCHKESKYSFSELLKFIPIDRRPKELPIDEVLILFLAPLKTERPLDNPSFGQLVRAKVLERQNDTFFCQLIEKSLISPLLTNKDTIYCRVVSGYIFAFDKLVNDSLGERWEPIQTMLPPKGSVFGLFFVKQGSLNSELIIPANPKCANPSCNYFFSYTASKLQELLKSNPQTDFSFDEKHILIECPICSTNKLITESFVQTLYPL
jgi:hypothetical protein